MRETTISGSVSELSDASVNYIHTPRGERFNSTMKQSYSQNYSQSNYNNSYNNSNNYSNSSSYQNTFNQRRLQRYKHQSRWPKKNIKFKYNARDKDMMGNIRRTINYIKEGAQNREAARRFQKFTNRATEEVSEDSITTITIKEIQTILQEDVDLIFDALVIVDYIENEVDI